MAISQSLLIRKSASFQQPIFESMQKSASVKRMKTAFLCHSHKDESIVKGLLAVFQEAGINLYIDWKDHSMPDVPNAETAKKIQDRIKGSELFFFLATSNAKASRWCPWEIGYADSDKRSIYIIPTVDSNGIYGNEYLELYPKIDEGSDGTKSGFAIYGAGKSQGNWLSTNSF